MTASPTFPLSGETRTDARSSGRTVPGDITSPPSPGTTIVCVLPPDDETAAFFQMRGVPKDFGVPLRALAWINSRNIVDAAVACYANGKAASLLLTMDGVRSLTFDEFAA